MSYYILGTDVGTTGTKSVLINAEGKIIASAYKGYKSITDVPNHVEQNADDWWNTIVHTVKKCVEEIDNVNQVKAISLSTQGGSMVAVDKNGHPISNAVVWLDKRGTKEKDELINLTGKDYFYPKTGWCLSNWGNLVQIKWLKNNKPDIFKNVHKFLSTVDYVNFKLTGKYVIDYTNAAMTVLFDINEKKWDKRLLDILDINECSLSDLMASGTRIGKLTPQAALELGLHENVEVYSGAHDQYCAALGAGAINNGDIVLSTGTAWVITGSFDKAIFDSNKFIHPGINIIENKWGIIVSAGTSGVSLEWFRENIGIAHDSSGDSVIEDFIRIDKEASQKPPGSEGLIFYPYFNGSTGPLINQNIKGTLLGISLNHDKYHISRAIMEGIALDINWKLETLKNKVTIPSTLKVLGGATKSSLWMQILSDITGMNLVMPQIPDIACMGAAIIAGKGFGVFFDYKDGYSKCIQQTKKIAPDMDNHNYYKTLYKKYKAICPLLNEVYKI